MINSFPNALGEESLAESGWPIDYQSIKATFRAGKATPED